MLQLFRSHQVLEDLIFFSFFNASYFSMSASLFNELAHNLDDAYENWDVCTSS